jgi:hypothetical protein
MPYLDQHMASRALDALTGEEILESNSLGTVTSQWVVVRPPESRSEMIISLSHISNVRTVRTTYPGLLVVAGAALLIAAAAAASKQGSGAALPIALFGVLFLIAYWVSRKASVVFIVGTETTHTPAAGLREAAKFVAAVEKALARVDRDNA